MKTIFKIQKHSSKHARSMDIFEEEIVKNYYLTLTKNFSKAIRVGLLYIDDKPIAYQYGFFCKNYYVGDQIAYREEYAKLGPGKILVYYLAEDLKKHGAVVLDQGGGLSTFKQGFTSQYRVLYNLYYSQNVLITTWWKMINKARRMRQIFFPKKNTRDHEFLFKTL